MCIYNVYHVLVLRQFNMLIVQAGDDDCVGNECSDVEARVNEARRETDCQRECFDWKKLTFTNW